MATARQETKRSPILGSARTRRAAALLIPLFMVSLLAACGGELDTPTASAEVEKDALAEFESVLVTAWTGSLTPNSASLKVETAVDVICAWAYGTTTDYGKVVTHREMSMATGHKIHNPMLENLQPDTLYHYRFGAVGPDGTMYRSGDFTFRTPPQ